MADSQRKTAQLWDEQYLVGYYSSSNEFKSADNQLCTKNMFQVKPNTTYWLGVPFATSGFLAILKFDSTGTFIERISLSNYIGQGISYTTDSNTYYININFSSGYGATYHNDIIIAESSTALPYEPYGWVHSLRKMSSATETITTGQTIYANGQPITTYNIKGNGERTGTPSPQNPVMPNGCGERTANLFNAYNTWTKRTGADVIDIQDNGATISITTTLFCYTSVNVTANTDYILTCTSSGGIARNIAIYKSTSFTTENLIASLGATGGTFNSGTNTKLYILFYASNNSQSATAIYNDVRMNTGSTSQPFEPYGYIIPISSGSTTTNIYLGSTSSTRQIQKLVLTGQENWNMRTDDTHIFYLVVSGMRTYSLCLASHYKFVTTSIPANLNSGEITTYLGQGVAIWTKNDGIESVDDYKYWLSQQYNNGTPVTVWYVLATETTGIVNEPLQKIGDYADSISNATPIPTTDGANTITVDTTVQPSEFTATWTGWHDAEVKEKSENLFTKNGATDGKYIDGSGNEQDSTSAIYQFAHTALLPINPSGEFTFSLVAQAKNAGTSHRIIGYDSNGDYIAELANLIVSTNEAGFKSITFNTPSNCNYITINYVNTHYPNTADLNIMLNSGSTAQTYEPYWK